MISKSSQPTTPKFIRLTKIQVSYSRAFYAWSVTKFRRRGSQTWANTSEVTSKWGHTSALTAIINFVRNGTVTNTSGIEYVDNERAFFLSEWNKAFLGKKWNQAHSKPLTSAIECKNVICLFLDKGCYGWKRFFKLVIFLYDNFFWVITLRREDYKRSNFIWFCQFH